jgi:phosphotransferase system HPr (HPr) family protein
MNTKDIPLTPAELLAIEDHKYFMSQRSGAEVSIEDAIDDFLKCYAESWRREKMRRDAMDQIREIERHKYLRSMQEGRDIGRNVAAEEWCSKYAHIWRRERESLERNGFMRMSVTVGPEVVHVRPTSRLAEIARRFDAEVYVHKPGMVYYNFRLNGEMYMNVRSVLGLLSMDIQPHDRIEFIAMGAQARQALDAIAAAVTEVPVQAV